MVVSWIICVILIEMEALRPGPGQILGPDHNREEHNSRKEAEQDAVYRI